VAAEQLVLFVFLKMSWRCLETWGCWPHNPPERKSGFENECMFFFY